MYGKKIRELKGMLQSLHNTVSRNDKAVWDDRTRTDRRFESLSDSLVRSKVKVAELETQVANLNETINNLLRIVKVAGIVEVAETGDNLFQFYNTVDTLQRNPLYKINKVVPKCRA